MVIFCFSGQWYSWCSKTAGLASYTACRHGVYWKPSGHEAVQCLPGWRRHGYASWRSQWSRMSTWLQVSRPLISSAGHHTCLILVQPLNRLLPAARVPRRCSARYSFSDTQVILNSAKQHTTAWDVRFSQWCCVMGWVVPCVLKGDGYFIKEKRLTLEDVIISNSGNHSASDAILQGRRFRSSTQNHHVSLYWNTLNNVWSLSQWVPQAAF